MFSSKNEDQYNKGIEEYKNTGKSEIMFEYFRSHYSSENLSNSILITPIGISHF